MRYRLVIIMLLISGFAFCQPDIVYIEYYIDTDPGFGLGQPLSFTAANEVEVEFNFPVMPLSNGHHLLVVRARDINNNWGIIEARPFYKLPDGTTEFFNPTGIDYIEYYFDDDPGLGGGMPITGFTPGDLEYEKDFQISTLGLSTGLHTLNIRARNTDNEWGIIETRPFRIVPDPSPDVFVTDPVVEVEYFIDDIATASTVYTSAGEFEVNLNEIIAAGTTTGLHILGVRAKNDQGEWGIYEVRPFYIVEPSIPDESAQPGTPIQKLEYFFNDDPGVGQATEYPITPGLIIDFSADPGIDIPTPSNIPVGFNTVTFRAMNANGEWGQAETRQFEVIDDCTQPAPLFSPQLACAGEPVTFIDQSSDVQLDATYEWDLDGDGLTDNTTTGDVTFTYTNPGDYDVTLRIQQGQICDQSYMETITILPKPVVAFSILGNVVNQPVSFEVVEDNIPPGATWSWDFDGDGNEDSNSAGPTLSYTYTSEGSYDPIVTVSDGNGCEDTYTRNVVIQSSSGGGGGGGSPLVAYSVTTVCLGSSTAFIDQSQNIPDEATYSWDFGDGNSSTFEGSTNHVYSSSGTFSSKLTIDFGGGVTEEVAKQVDVVAFPTAAFDVVPTCVISPVQFADNSTDVSGAATYSWDFNNDGVEDSSIKGGTAFTYPNAGNYIAKLSINNGSGCTDELTVPVQVLQEPIADFTFESACAGEQVLFTDTSTGLETSVQYSWDLDGDDVEDSKSADGVTFTYEDPGTYTVKLVVKNDDSCVSEKMLELTVPQRPIADFEVIARCYGQVSEIVDLSENVDNNSTYSWDLDGDGAEDDTTNGSTSFTYPEFASYIARLTVDNGSGCISNTEYLVVFKDAALPEFEVSPSCSGQETVFTDLSTQLEVGSTYSWDFDGDGLEDSAEPGSVSFRYQNAGTYTARLTIDNGNQCLAVTERSVEVTPPPAVALGPDRLLCEETPEILDPGPGYETYQWSTGETSQSITVETFGSYTVLITDIKGCINRDTIEVRLKDAPKANFDYRVRLSPTEGFIVTFINLSEGAESYEWDFGLDEKTLLENEVEPEVPYNEFYLFYGATYEVCLTAIDQCGSSDQFCQSLFLSPTAVEDEDLDWLRIYPNPGSGLFKVDVDRNNEIKRINVFDANGLLVWEEDRDPGDHFEIDLRKESMGVYLIYIETDESSHFNRLILR